MQILKRQMRKQSGKNKNLKLKQPNDISISCYLLRKNLDIIVITTKNNIQLTLNLNLLIFDNKMLLSISTLLIGLFTGKRS